MVRSLPRGADDPRVTPSVRLLAMSALTTVCLALTGCGGGGSPAPQNPPATAGPPVFTGPPVDPMHEFTDPKAAYFLSEDLVPYVHESGKGSFTQTYPAPTKRDLQFFVTCAPKSDFALTLGTGGAPYAGTCDKFFTSVGEFRLARGTEQVEVSLTVADDVQWYLVGIEAPKS